MMSKYPNLTFLLNEMAEDNRTTLTPENTWPAIAADMELLAARLTDAEKSVLACGDDWEQRRLVQRHDIHALYTFLNDVFDGDLTPAFYGRSA